MSYVSLTLLSSSCNLCYSLGVYEKPFTHVSLSLLSLSLSLSPRFLHLDLSPIRHPSPLSPSLLSPANPLPRAPAKHTLFLVSRACTPTSVKPEAFAVRDKLQQKALKEQANTAEQPLATV